MWERVLSNVRGIHRHLSRDKITLGFVAHGDNIDELPDFVRLAGELDVWHVRIAPIFVHKPDHIRRSLWFCKEKTKDLIEEARHIGRPLGVIVSNIHDSVRHMSSSAGERCIMPKFGSYIEPNGDVIPCCYAGTHIMGNVCRAGSFGKVWNGKKYRALRDTLYFRHCRACPNIKMDIDRLDNQVSFEAIARARESLPLVSVILRTPESPDALNSALARLAEQTYPVWEALVPVSDDGGDSLPFKAEGSPWADPRIRPIPLGEPHDPRAAILRACSEAKGSYVAVLDPARPCRPDRLERSLAAFETLGPEWVVVYETPEGPELFDLDTAMARRGAFVDLLAGWNGRDGRRLHRLRQRVEPGADASAASRLCRHGEALMGTGFTEEAGAAFVDATVVDPSCVDAYNNLGAVQWALGNPVDAILYLSKALSIDPANRTGLGNLAEVFVSMGAFGKARATIGRILENYPEDEDAKRLLERLASAGNGSFGMQSGLEDALAGP